jgi:hypothetical protein
MGYYSIPFCVLNFLLFLPLISGLVSINRPSVLNFSSFLAFTDYVGSEKQSYGSHHGIESRWQPNSLLKNDSYIHHCGALESRGHYFRVRPYRVIVSSNMEFLNVFLNWLIFYYHQCRDLSSVFLICLDDSVQTVLRTYSLRCSYSFLLPKQRHDALSFLWLLRISIANTLVKEGFDVVLSDTDATWLRNPFHYMSNFPSANVIASKATFPEEIHKAVGATVCMGFVYFKSVNGSGALLDNLFEYMLAKPIPDDQRDINELLLHNHVHFDVKPSFLGNVVSMGKLEIQGKFIISILFLPQNRFIRFCNLPQHYLVVLNSTVAHCLGGKKASEKALIDRILGFWLLRDDWRSVAPQLNASTTAFPTDENVRGVFIDNFFAAIKKNNVTTLYDLAARLATNASNVKI